MARSLDKIEALLRAEEPPLSRAARRLRDTMEHLDPSERGALAWEDLEERERSFYRSCIEDMVLRIELLDACFIQLSHDNGVNRRSDLGE